MECNVFSGCLYECPTADDGERDWRIDSESGEQFPFDLTVSEIKNMAIEGVPIKLEHAEKGFERGDEVGRVIEVSVHPVSGYTACKFQLHDTIAGRSATELIKKDTLKSLSLGHEYDPRSGATRAKEVSICFEGARKGSCLYKELGEYEKFRKEMATIEDPPTADLAAATPPPGGGGLQQADVSEPPNEEAPALDLTSLLERVCANQPPEIAEQLYGQVAKVAERVKKGDEKNNAMNKTIEELQMKVEHTNEESRQKAKECVNVFNALMKEYVGDTQDIAYDEGDQGKAFANVVKQVPVLASALHRHHSVLKATQQTNIPQLAEQIKRALFCAPEGPLWVPKEAPYTAAIDVKASHKRGGEAYAGHQSKMAKMGSRMTSAQEKLISGIGSGDDTIVAREHIPASMRKSA